MYIGFNAEPNSIAGLTGRAYYATGDITGVASQYPYGPFQVEGTWLHGFDHTLATYMDNQATILLNGQNIAWIGGGTTASPTGTATIGTFGSGTSTGLLLRPATSGYIATSTPLVVGGGTTAQSVTVNGASGADNGFVWQTAGNTRWKLSLNGSDDINLYAFNSSGGFVGTIFAANSTALYVQVDLNAARVGFNGTGAITKPTGYGTPTGTATRATFATGSVTLPVLAEHVKALIDDLTAYGLIAP
jgi:hypothetical protein